MDTDASTNPTSEEAGTERNGTGAAASTAALEAELAAANAKAEENFNKYLYAMADFENYKKRTERTLSEMSLAGKRSVLTKFLPVMDNLERALAFQSGADGLRGGLQATLRVFESVLAGENVRPIPLKGTPFDPRVAEAIGTQAPSDGVPDDTVLEEAERGYMLGDELLRPAKVIVAKTGGV